MNLDSHDSNSEILVRMFSILKMLEAGHLTIHHLSVVLKRSVRTIQRDIDLLQRVGYPIVMDSENNEFYLVSNYGVPSMTFTLPEALALLVALQENGRSGAAFVEESNKAALKIASTLSPEFLGLVSDLRDQFLALDTPKEISNQKNSFEMLLDAVAAGNVVRAVYRSPAEPAEIETDIYPYVVFWGKRSWYMAGFTALYGEVRLFKISRFSELKLTKKHFNRPSGFSLRHFLGNAWNMIPSFGPDQEIKIRFSPKVAQNVAEVRWHATQETRFLPDGSLEARFVVSGLNEISWWVLGYGAEAEVVQPPELREILKKHIARMSEIYKI